MSIIRKAKYLVLTALLLSLSHIASAETIMRVASWLPPTHVQNAVVWPTWGKWIEEATEGRVKLEIEYGLGHPKTLFELVEDGVADASFSYHGYVPGRFKLALGVEEPLMGASAEATSVAYWRVHQKYFAAANEHDGLTVAGVFVHGPGQIQTIEPITSLADLKGKKIRIGGGVPSEIGHRLGVTPVGAPAPKVYELLQQGIVDGVFLPIAEQKTLRLNEVARNVVMLPGGMYLGSFSIFINPDFLDSLSEKDRSAIMSVSGEQLSAMAGKAWDSADAVGLKTAEEAGVNLVKVSENDAFEADFQQLVEGMDQIWLDSVADRGIDAQSALAELRSIARSYKE